MHRGQLIDGLEEEGVECPLDSTLTTDVASVEGVHIHTVTFDIPADADNRSKIVKLVGETATIAIGFGPEAIYVAAGYKPVEILSYVITESAGAANDATRCQASLSVRSLARFMSVHGENEKERSDSATALTILDSYEDASDVSVTIEAIPAGRRLVVEIEEGIIRLIAAMAEEKMNN